MKTIIWMIATLAVLASSSLASGAMMNLKEYANADDKSTRLLRGQSSENRKVYTENERAAAAKSARAYLVSKGPDEYRKYVKSKIEKEKKDKDNAPWDN